jgi:hypothetical protein
MKKVLLALVIIFTLSAVTCFAAPFNTLEPGQSDAGLVYWGANSVSDDDWSMGGIYLEHKVSDKLTIGLETIGRTDYAIDSYYYYFVALDSSLTDIYLQYHIGDNCRILLGNKLFSQDLYDTYGSYGYYTDSKPYVGVAVTSKLSDSVEGYAALTTADTQVGANLNFTNNLSGNIFYRTCSIENLDLSGIGFGLTWRFNTNHTIEKDRYKKGSPKEKGWEKTSSAKGKDWDQKGSPKEEDRNKKGNPKEEDRDKKGSPKEEDRDKKGSPEEKDRDKKGSLKEEDRDKKGSPKEEDRDKKGSPKEENSDKKGSPKEEDRDKKDSPKEKGRDKKGGQIEEEWDEKGSPTGNFDA